MAGQVDVRHTAFRDKVDSLVAEDTVRLDTAVGASLAAEEGTHEHKEDGGLDREDAEPLEVHAYADLNGRAEVDACQVPVQSAWQLGCDTDIHWAVRAHHSPSLENSTSLVVVAVARSDTLDRHRTQGHSRCYSSVVAEGVVVAASFFPSMGLGAVEQVENGCHLTLERESDTLDA